MNISSNAFDQTMLYYNLVSISFLPLCSILIILSMYTYHDNMMRLYPNFLCHVLYFIQLHFFGGLKIPSQEANKCLFLSSSDLKSHFEGKLDLFSIFNRKPGIMY